MIPLTAECCRDVVLSWGCSDGLSLSLEVRQVLDPLAASAAVSDGGD
jgi:hypothetical protein